MLTYVRLKIQIKKKGKKDSRNGEVPFAMPLMCVQRRRHVERPWVGRTVTSMLLSTALLYLLHERQNVGHLWLQ